MKLIQFCFFSAPIILPSEMQLVWLCKMQMCGDIRVTCNTPDQNNSFNLFYYDKMVVKRGITLN